MQAESFLVVIGAIPASFLNHELLIRYFWYFVDFGVGIHVTTGVIMWRIPFGFQLVPAGIMVFGLLTVMASPRWLASVGRNKEAIVPSTKRYQFQKCFGWKCRNWGCGYWGTRGSSRFWTQTAFFGKGNLIRFIIAFVMFLIQEWNDHNFVKWSPNPQTLNLILLGYIYSHYAPRIFASHRLDLPLERVLR